MKLRLDELVDKNYYLCYVFSNIRYIIKYKSYDNDYVYCYDTFICIRNDGVELFEDSIFFCEINWYNISKTFENVDISDVIDYFPDKHPDKLSYMRSRKIKYLLNK